MSKAKQCPSSVGNEPATKEREPLDRSAATGRAYWRSLDEIADTPEFREFLEREFPASASELAGESRRDFLRVMAASIALVGAASVPGCRRSDHKILPYNRDPEDVIHGKPLFYGTAMLLPGGGAEGLLAEAHEGRPTKLEGNPLHPINRGKSGVFAQAAALDLYDPDRLVQPTRLAKGEPVPVTWRQIDGIARSHFRQFDLTNGRGLAFLVSKVSSPTRDAMRNRILERWPEAKWLPYEPIDNEAELDGTRIAFGRPCRTVHAIEKARRILSIESDWLSGYGDGASIADQRGFGAGRTVTDTHDDMSRLYAVESMMTLAGASADNRLALKPSEIPAYVAKLAGRIAPDAVAGSDLAGAELDIDSAWIESVAADLLAHRGASVVIVGASQPAEVHGLVAAINSALGAIGETVHYVSVEGDEAASSLESIRTLSRDMKAGRVETLVTIDTNPVYDAPVELDFAERHAKVKTTMHLSLHFNETAAASTYRLNKAHFLESWGDAVAADGARSVIQPMVEPLGYVNAEHSDEEVQHGRTDLEFLAMIVDDELRDPFEIVRRTWGNASSLSGEAFEKRWRQTLHDGFEPGSAGSALRGNRARVRTNEVVQAMGRLRAPAARSAIDLSDVEVLFRPSATLFDGRYANNGWLQELPDPMSKVTWDNPAIVSPATAKAMGLVEGAMIDVTVDGRTLTLPIWRQPGLPDGLVVLELGYGRERVGRVGDGVGFNTYKLRTGGALRRGTGKIAAAVGEFTIACVQTHWAMEGRALVREADLVAWQKHGDEVIVDQDHYGRERRLDFGDRFGVESHSPAIVDIYEDDQEHHYTNRLQWAMSIDLNKCIGCAACTIACQAENNIPVVGKDQVNRGREMHWIRIDRYYASQVSDPSEAGFEGDFGDAGPYTGGRTGDDVDVLMMPVPCQQCENAPCETVCPVNATVHSPEGLNDMAYNRCIGTRYCANNCPYKVRRFNFFDYATKRLDGDYVGKEALDGVVPSADYIPPRLRQKIDEGKDELQTMQYNPDVTVRERGVMEKCTYCVQRINEARVEVKTRGLEGMPDGFFETACQQACPTEAIVFGNKSDENSRVSQQRENHRSYGMLSYLSTKPRTTYMVKLRNPNPAIRATHEDPFHHGGGHETHSDETHTGNHDDGHADAGVILRLPVLTSTGGLA